MTKKTRTILFLVCLVLFLLVAPAIVFYSQGYRVDLNPPAGGKIITQTGGLFLKTLPKQVEIYLNEKLKKKTDFFFGSVLIENLLPGKYKVAVEKEGFYPWQKTLEIKEKEVVEAKNIVLFPENLEFNVLIDQVENFWFSSDEKGIVLKENSPAGGEDGWALKLYELDKEIKSHLIEEKDISLKDVDLLNLKFSEDSKKISLEVGVAEQIKYFTLSLEKTPPALTEEKAILPPIENVLTFEEIDNDIYYLDNFGNLFKNEEKLTEINFPVKQETKYALEIFQDFIFLIEGNDLYKLNSDSKSFEKFFEDIRMLKISPDSKKIVYFSNYEIWILFLKDTEENPAKRAGEKLFLMRLSEKIEDIFWLNSDYLVFNVGNKIKITEIDARDRINIIELTEIKNPRIFWNKTDKRLYLLSEGNLYRSGIILP